jgi:hypothetical protein
MAIVLFPLSDLRDQYAAALEWLKRQGVRVDGTRLARYLRTLTDAESAEQRGIEEHQTDPTFVNAIAEAADIIDVAKLDPAFFSDHHAAEKLRRISHGREIMPPDEADPAHDYAFEFATAWTLHEVDRFGGFSPHAGDLAIAPNGWPVECKRISSLARLEARLREARDQLQCAVAAGDPPGLTAIDLSTPIRAAQGHVSAADDDGLLEISSRQLTAYIGRYVLREDWLNALSRPENLGICVRYVSIGFSGDRASIRRNTIWQACCLHPEGSPENDLFLQLAAHCGRGELTDGTREDRFEAARTVTL